MTWHLMLKSLMFVVIYCFCHWHALLWTVTHDIHRYNQNLEDAKRMGIKKAISSNIAMGFTFLMIYLSYALAFWYGTSLILKDEYTIGNLLTVSRCILLNIYIFYAYALPFPTLGRLKKEGCCCWRWCLCVWRCSSLCSLELSAWDKPHPTSRPSPVPEEPHIKSTASLIM